ncbi:uncharacterized protein LOC106663913 isoform X2 [Cimex lectularius]|uniref:Uncharacterized protein n=1 Tax=Cimex lectularius TaxID=79782 RepID=A0A8I6RGP4_CIMLE|nr:uncharacterized protein LOC106663913 isoform X2 [Cimex lectularius]
MSDSDQPPSGLQNVLFSIGAGIVSTIMVWCYLHNLNSYPDGPPYCKCQYERYVEEPDWLAITGGCGDKSKNQGGTNSPSSSNNNLKKCETKKESKLIQGNENCDLAQEKIRELERRNEVKKEN